MIARDAAEYNRNPKKFRENFKKGDIKKQHSPASVFGGGAVKESSEVPVGKGRIVMVIVRRPFERTVLCQHIGAGDGFADELPAKLVHDKHGL